MSDASASNSRQVLWPMYVVVLGLIAAFSFVAWRNNQIASSRAEDKRVGVEQSMQEFLVSSELWVSHFSMVTRPTAIL